VGSLKALPLRRFVPWLGLALSLVMVLSTWFLLRWVQLNRTRDRFGAEAALLQVRITGRVATHEQILRGAAEFIARGQDLPTREEWRHFVQALDMDHLNPGVQALGFAQWIPFPDLDRHVRRMRAGGLPDYSVRPGGPLAADGGVSSIIYTEPFDSRNQRTFARDMLAEATRRQAMVRARDLGAVSLSGKVRLLQEDSSPVQAGTVLYVPVYRRGRPLGTLSQRREALLGWAYLAFRMQNLLEGILGSGNQGIRLALYDGASARDEDLLFARPGPQAPAVRSWTHRDAFEVAGRTWTLWSAPGPDFGAAAGAISRDWILGLGLLFSGVIFALLQSFARAERRALEMAGERLEKVQALLESTGEAIYGIDLRGACTFCNPALLRILGYASAGQLLGRNMHDLIHHPSEPGTPRPAGTCQLLEAFRAGAGSHLADELFWRADGSSFPAECWSFPQFHNGEVVGAVVTFQDITERKRAQAALRLSEERLSLALASSGMGTFEWDIPRDFRRFDSTVFRLIGLDPEGFNGTVEAFYAAIHPEDREFVRSSLARAMLDGHYETEYRAVWADGSVHHIAARGQLFLDPQGRPARLNGVLWDISEQKAAAREKARLETRLQQGQRMESLGLLAAGVAHNINNVLAIVMGTASLREGPGTVPEDLEAFRTIGKVCQRGREVVKSLMQFGLRTVPNQAPVDLHALVKEVRVLLDNTTRNSLRIVEALAPEPVWILGNSGTLSHSLLNLGLNALDAMPGGGTLTFRTGSSGDGWVSLAVEDSGCGMAPEVLAHVMEPFFTTKEVGQGTGLGLSMTYGVVQAHGGTIDISSRPGEGTRVTLRFPRIPAPVQDVAPGAAPPLLDALSVFLVDDDEDVRFLMARMLRRAGVRGVRAFAGGAAVLAGLRAEAPPDLVILDQNMPGMTGIQTLERIRETWPELPVLISSGQPDIEQWPCFQASRVAVISKPFNLEEIHGKLAGFALDSGGHP